MARSKRRQTNKEVWQEAKREGFFSEAFNFQKKKYKFKGPIDAIVSIAAIILALVVVAWARRL